MSQAQPQLMEQQPTSPEAAALAVRALELQAEGALDEARAVFTEILEREPDNVVALYSLGALAFNAGRRAEGKHIWTRVTQLMPAFLPAWGALATAFEADRAIGASWACVERALEIAPAHPPALLQGARLLKRAHRNGEALQWIDALLRVDPQNSEAKAERAEIVAHFRSNYAWGIEIISGRHIIPFRTIFELGSRDANDALWLARSFPRAMIHAFEANPDSARICRENIAFSLLTNIALVDKAVTDANGTVTFYPFDVLKYDNVGASSLFQMDFKQARPIDDPEYGRENPQDKIQVPATRLDTYCASHKINKVDLICMDLQGGELLALQSLGPMLGDVPYVIAEASHHSAYRGGCTFAELNDFVRGFGFTAISEIPPDSGYYFDFNVIWENAGAAESPLGEKASA